MNAGVNFRHAPVHVLVLGDPRASDAFPCAQSWTSWKAHFYSSLANCVLQMLLAAEALGRSSMYISDVASPYFSVMLESLLGIPEPLQIYHLLPIGFAKRGPTIHHPRRALEENSSPRAVRPFQVLRRGGASGLYDEGVPSGAPNIASSVRPRRCSPCHGRERSGIWLTR